MQLKPRQHGADEMLVELVTDNGEVIATIRPHLRGVDIQGEGIENRPDLVSVIPQGEPPLLRVRLV